MKNLENNYDYIIVGGGSAGCVIARRLVESGNATVLLLETGNSGDGVPTIEKPPRWIENIGSPNDYLYKYHPTPLLNNRDIYVPRGKVLGGSGSINAMVWARGHQDDYNNWSLSGNPGWDYESVLPLFKKIEDWEGGATAFHGQGGPLHIENTKSLHAFDRGFIAAGMSYGMPYLPDTNGPAPEGVGPMSMNIKDGKRWSPYIAYLKPVMDHENLTVITGARVLNLTSEDDVCTGVRFEKDNQIYQVNTEREVILTAGVMETPRILMLSGIGDASDLNALGIQSKINLSGVGKNLQEHPLISVIYELKEPIGELTENLGGSNLYWKSHPDLKKPDLMLLTIRVAVPTDEIAKQHPVPKNAVAVFVTLVDVKSRGYIKLTDKNPDAPMEIQPNLLQEENDMDAMIRGIELCMELAEEPGLKEIIQNWVSPPKQLNRDEIRKFVKDACSHYFHTVGSCVMGTGANAVVNPKLQVYGIKNLRIADASVMPRIPTANTNAPTLMIAEFAAELILGQR